MQAGVLRDIEAGSQSAIEDRLSTTPECRIKLRFKPLLECAGAANCLRFEPPEPFSGPGETVSNRVLAL